MMPGWPSAWRWSKERQIRSCNHLADESVLDGIVIDIALDGLFGDVPPVIVTENSGWHDQFSCLDEHPVAIHVYDDLTVAMLHSQH